MVSIIFFSLVSGHSLVTHYFNGSSFVRFRVFSFFCFFFSCVFLCFLVFSCIFLCFLVFSCVFVFVVLQVKQFVDGLHRRQSSGSLDLIVVCNSFLE